MSIAGITSNPWTIPYTSQGGLGSTTPGAITLFAPDLFQQLAADAQALLLRGPSAAAQPAAATGSGGSATGGATNGGGVASTGGGTAPVTPEQQLATDLQSFFTQLQSVQPGSDPNAQAGTTTDTAAAGEAQPHHHHHHHHHQSGGSSGDANASGGTTASSPASTSQSSTPNGDQTLSEAFAASVVQAIQAYSSPSPATATTSLTV